MDQNVKLLFRATGIGKRFAVPVLDNVGIEIRGGEIHGLLGANGAGKSTLSKIIAGMHRADAGQMELLGTAYSPLNKGEAESRGVQIVHQELGRIASLTVAENLFLGRLPSCLGIISRRKLYRDAQDVLARFDLGELDPDQLVQGLGVGTQQMLEIAAALIRPGRLLILDEPTAALSAKEVEHLFVWLEERKRNGAGIIYISHRLDEVLRIADRVTVLRDGNVAYSGATPREQRPLIQAMAGPEGLASGNTFRSSLRPTLALEVRNLHSGQAVHGVSFRLHRGERLGIAGLVGAGRTECVEAIFGKRKCERGEVIVHRDSTRAAESRGSMQRARTPFKHPSNAVRAGLALVPEDRKHLGVLLDLSIAANVTVCKMSQECAPWSLNIGQFEKRTARDLEQRLDIRCETSEQAVRSLSGGNQQKVAIAKWLATNADIFLFDEPTRGVDVVARHLIYGLIQELCEAGKGVVMVSSDLDELMENCDRICVMSNGRLISDFERGSWTREQLTAAMFAGFPAKNFS
jgi:ribose transport system ATP-binding protein